MPTPNGGPRHELTEGNISKTLFFFTLPILAGNVLQSLNGSINAVWVGHFLGRSALTASSNSNAILFFLIGVMFGVSMATTILVGQSIGRNDLDLAKRVIGSSATFFVVVSAVMATAGFFASNTVLAWMHTPEDALPYATAYLRIIFLGIPFLYLYSFLMMSLRGAGDSKTPFFFLIVSVGLDVALNPLFIFGWGPVPKMGIAGSALATLVANVVSLTLLVAYLYRTKHFLRIRRNELHYLRLDGAILRSLVAKGLPMGMQMIVLSLGMIVMIRLVNRFGSGTTAAYGASLQLWNYIQMPAFAVGQAVSSMAAQNVGAGKWDRVDRVTLVGVAFNFALTGTLVAIVTRFGPYALALFLPDAATIAIAQHINVVITWSFILFGVTFVLSGVMRSTGAVIPPLLILFFAVWIARIPFAYFFLGTMGADAIWWSFPLGSVISLVLSVAYYRFGGWRSARMLAPSRPSQTEPVTAASGPT
jgi:putative MATE family efflux protein